MDTGVERIEDPLALDAARAQARRILLQSLAWTAVVLAVMMVLP
jgi:hypothetical protein